MAESGIVMLRVLRILRRHSDESHRLQQKDIRALYEQQYGQPLGIKALRHALRDLAEDVETDVGCDERTVLKKHRDGSIEPETVRSDFYALSPFTDEALRLLVDMVAFSAYLTPAFRRDLTEALAAQTSRHFRFRNVQMSDRHVQENPQFLLSVKVLDEALERSCQVSFRYLTFEEGSRPVARSDAAGQTRSYQISPYQFVIDSGRYYIICSDGRHSGLRHYRVDRMLDAQLLPDCPAAKAGQDRISADLREYRSSHPYMLSGTPERAVIACRPGAMPQLIDTFGKPTGLNRRQGEFLADIYAVPAAIRRFVRIFAPQVRIVSPDHLREEFVAELQEMLAIHAAPPGGAE